MGILNDIMDGVGLTDTAGAKKTAKKGRAITQETLDRIKAMDIPDIEKQKLLLDNPELVGLLDAENIDPSKMTDIQLDPRLKQNQMSALQDLQDRANEGLTSTDKYNMEKLLGDVSANERSQRASVEADLARKGLDSSGAALIAKLQAGQSGANNAREQAMQMAAQGQQNKLSALQALGNQSRGMENADFSRQAQTASAQDAISRANAMNRQNVAGQNLTARQNIENQRSNISNQQQIANKGLYQQQFQNKVAKEGLMSGASGNLANQYASQAGAQAGADAAMVGNVFGLGKAVATGGMAQDGGIMRNNYAEGGIVEKANMPVQYQGEDANEMYRAAETKQHESFKKKYMKRIQDEVMGTYQDKPKTPAKPEGVSGEAPKLEDGGIIEQVTQPSELTEEGTDFAAPEDRQASVYAALKAALGNMNPENNIPRERYEDGGTYMSDGSGDIIDSGEDSYAGDRIDAQVNDGEAVINLPQQQRLMDLLRGKIGLDELGTDDIVEGVPREYSENMHERLDSEKEPEDDSEGEIASITKLLQMLGK